MTKKQQQFSEWAKNYIKKYKRWPKIIDIQKRFKLSSKASAWQKLDVYKQSIYNCPLCKKKLI